MYSLLHTHTTTHPDVYIRFKYFYTEILAGSRTSSFLFDNEVVEMSPTGQGNAFGFSILAD
jgi:hypothetical protein